MTAEDVEREGQQWCVMEDCSTDERMNLFDTFHLTKFQS